MNEPIIVRKSEIAKHLQHMKARVRKEQGKGFNPKFKDDWYIRYIDGRATPVLEYVVIENVETYTMAL